jgi:hypothetical protein
MWLILMKPLVWQILYYLIGANQKKKTATSPKKSDRFEIWHPLANARRIFVDDTR